MKKNHGFSLLEMILVIGIAGILAGSSVLALNYLRYADVKKCANEINSMLDKVRVLSMTKSGNTYLYIYMLDGRCYMKTDSGTFIKDGSGTLLSKGDITITAISDEGAPSKTVSDTVSIKIFFSRSNGALKPDPDNSEGKSYNKIKVHSDNGEYVIRIIKLTGKHYIE